MGIPAEDAETGAMTETMPPVPAGCVVVGVDGVGHGGRAPGQHVDESQRVGVVRLGRTQDQLGLRDGHGGTALSGHHG